VNPRPNILLIRLKSIGDVLFTLPAVNTLRENFPDAKITFFTTKENAPLLRGFREVDGVVTLDRGALQKPLCAAPEMFRLLRRLRAGNFSLAVDFQGYGETAWLSWWTGAPERWGSVYGPGREWLYTRGVARDERIHHVAWNLSLLRQCGLKIGGIKNEFVLPEDALAEAREFFAENNLAPARLTLFLQPFTSTPFKNWPLENYLELARRSQSRGVQVIFGGGPADRAALEPARAAGFVVSAGMPLLVSAGLAKLSTLTVGGVTGLLHLAVAMQKRVVMLIGPKDEPGFPYQHRDWGVTPAAGSNAADIPLETVVEHCERALEQIE
jgi:ADP-heptose:LPS heptosyltransferase